MQETLFQWMIRIYELLYLHVTMAMSYMCIYTYTLYIHINVCIYLKKVTSFSSFRTWKLGEVLLGYIQYVLFIASRLFRVGGGEDIGMESPPLIHLALS